MSFAHLGVKSGYSFLSSTIQIDTYVRQVKKLGYQSCAITDDDVLHGAYLLYKACKRENIKPVIGIKVSVYIKEENRPTTFYLYAKSFQGYKSLVQLSNQIKLNKEKVTLEMIESLDDVLVIVSFYDTYVEELIYLNDDERLNKLIKQINSQIDDWYIRCDPISANRDLVTDWLETSNHLYDQLVLVCDIRYLKEKDRIGFESLLAMQNSNTIENVRKENFKSTYLLSEQEVNEKLPEKWHFIKDRVSGLIDKCDVDFPNQWFGLPKYQDTDGLTSEEYLRKKCEDGMVSRYPKSMHEKARARMDYELNVIEEMQFSDYFLIVWDMVRFAKKNQILIGPGRGSAAGSIVAYLLGIIEVDPLEYDLLFERFLNPERRNMPDIDIDFSDYRREEVIQYVAKKYGHDRVAQIITFGTFQARSTIRELSKVFQIEKDQLNKLLTHFSSQSSSIVQTIKENKQLGELISHSSVLKQMFQAAVAIEGLPRHYSTHAAGIVISDQPLTELVPVVEGQDLVMLTQYPMQQLEAIGLLKMDLLGLRNLTLLERMVKQVQEIEGKTIDLIHLPLDNKPTYELFRRGFTTGVFQLESDGMKKALTAIQPNEIEDIVAVNALFRPGPMQFIDTFAKRKHGKEKTEYIHPDLEPILKSTYGVLVYQEQIMQAVHQFAGFSYGEADLLRRAISKKDRNALQEMKEAFVAGSLKKGYQEETALKLFDWIERFADYGFNKSHAVAYSLISYQTAFFKANYPAYFYSELMSSVMHDVDKLERYIKEAKEQGIAVFSPSINHSFGKFVVESPKKIRFGLMAIKGVGKQAYDEILKVRKDGEFKNIFDFCKRVNLSVINQSVIESLILSGAFDEENSNRAQLLAAIMPAMEQGELFSGIEEQMNWTEELFDMDLEYPNVEPFPMMQQLQMEKDVLGFNISPHPLTYIRRSLKREGLIPLKNLIKSREKWVQAVVNITRIHHIRTKRGERMAFLTLQDETTEIEAVLFPKLHREVYRGLEEGQFAKIQGKLEERQGKLQIILNQLEKYNIESVSKMNDRQIFIKVEEDAEEALTKLKELSQKNSGNTSVVIHIPSQNKTYKLSEQYDLEESEEVIRQLGQYFQTDNVKIKKLN